ncbi:MAG: hypothetical protein ACRDH9_03040 [Actinomycetota bacterium]
MADVRAERTPEWKAIRRLFLGAVAAVAIVGVGVSLTTLRGIRSDLSEQIETDRVEAINHRIASRCSSYFILRTAYSIAAAAEIPLSRTFLPNITGLDCAEVLSERITFSPGLREDVRGAAVDPGRSAPSPSRGENITPAPRPSGKPKPTPTPEPTYPEPEPTVRACPPDLLPIDEPCIEISGPSQSAVIPALAYVGVVLLVTRLVVRRKERT